MMGTQKGTPNFGKRPYRYIGANFVGVWALRGGLRVWTPGSRAQRLGFLLQRFGFQVEGFGYQGIYPGHTCTAFTALEFKTLGVRVSKLGRLKGRALAYRISKLWLQGFVVSGIGAPGIRVFLKGWGIWVSGLGVQGLGFKL